MTKVRQSVPSFRKSTAREYFESIVIAVILALIIRTWVVQAFKIPTGSMENNLLVGDHLLVNKAVFSPIAFDAETTVLPNGPVDRGDIVVFKFPLDPERDFIKRVIGLPGEKIELRDKTVYINDEPLTPLDQLSELPAVRIMTVHSAKGMEFKHVLIPFLRSGTFPQRYQSMGVVDRLPICIISAPSPSIHITFLFGLVSAIPRAIDEQCPMDPTVKKSC